MSRILIQQASGASVPNPDTGKIAIFHDSADNRLKVKKSDGSIVDYEASSGVRQVINKSANFTPQDNEKNSIYSYISGSQSILTLPLSLPVGFFAECVNLNTGKLTVEVEVGGTLLTEDTGSTTLSNQYGKIYFYKQSATEWVLLGDLSTSQIPLTLSGCVGWFDMGDPTTFVFSSANFVEELLDKSGASNNIIQPTAINQAERIIGGLNGLSTLRFSGNQYYDMGATLSAFINTQQDFALFTVSKQNAAANAGVVANEQNFTNNYSIGITYNSGSNEVRMFDGGTADIRGDLPSRSTWASMALRRNGVDTDSWILGVKEALNQGSSTSNNKNMFIGARDPGGQDPLNGEIAEIILYNRSLSDSEVAIILDYLNTKWGTV